MSQKSILSSKSVIDFVYMFCSNILKKVFGFVREIILAYFFGSSILYANYLLLKTVSDFLSQLTLGNALQANLMPKFTKLYAKSDLVDLSEVFIFSKGFVWKLFLFSQVVQLPIIWYISPDNLYLYISLSIFLGAVMSANFFNSIFLTILQSKGDFKKHSIATTLGLFVSTLVLYPFILLFNVIGVVFSRLFGILTLTIKYVKPLLAEREGLKATLTYSDFNLSVMILGNFANIIMLLGRFVAGADGGNEIAFFTYSVVLLNVLLTTVIINVNTIVLKIVSVKKELKIILFSSFIAVVLGTILILVVNSFSIEIVGFIFERGAFVSDDTLQTASYLKSLSWSFILIFVASTLFQPYFTLPQVYLKEKSKYLARPFILSVVLLSTYFYFNDESIKSNSLLMIQGLSCVSFVLSAFAFKNYYRYEN
jgi:putative peptidoglycan lipid II flippase